MVKVMEEKINIAKILKDKPEGTKLWTDMFGSVTLYVVTDACDAFQVKHHNKEPWFDEDGKLYKEGVLCIYPSKSMRDWEKFSWKKGDVLANGEGDYCVFKEFAHSSYQTVKAVFVKRNKESIHSDSCLLDTKDWHKASHSCTATYINTIEKELNGKLNMETLEIEPAQPEFKDGDIIKMTWDKYSAMVIFWEYSNFGKGFDSHVFFNIKTKIIEYNVHGHILQDTILRLATEEEKKQLFSALEKEGKAWDSEHKMIVDLPKNCEFKPFDKVICRDSDADIWKASFFSHYDERAYYPFFCNNCGYKYCLPYNDETAKLIGTTNNVEG